MEWIIEFVNRFLKATQLLLANPIYYLGLLIIILQFRKHIQLERKLFHTRLHSLFTESWRMLIWGWLIGLIFSFVFLFIGIQLKQEWIILIWIISLCLMIVKVRYLCIAYSVGVIGLLQFGLSFLPNASGLQWLDDITQLIAEVDLISLLFIVAILHMFEGALLWLQGGDLAVPIYVEGKRGFVIGGFQTQTLWIVPLFVLVPMEMGTTSVIPWGTYMGVDFSQGWGFIAFPAMIGFSQFALSRIPQTKGRQDGTSLFFFGIVILITAGVSQYFSWFYVVGASLSIFLHELLTVWSIFQEKRKKPLYVNDHNGLTVLAVIPKSLAVKRGIQTGEIIHRVNGVRIATLDQLYMALLRNSAYCKLEVMNLEGEIKFINTPLFDGDHHQLGIVFAPDPYTTEHVKMRHFHLFDYFRNPSKKMKSEQVKHHM